MSDLVWLIYGAAVTDKLSWMANLSVTLLSVFGVFFGLYWAVAWTQHNDSPKYNPPPPKLPWKLWLAALTVSVLLAVGLPSSRTIYLIAAVRAGEAVATSAEGRAVLEAARTAILDRLGAGAAAK